MRNYPRNRTTVIRNNPTVHVSFVPGWILAVIISWALNHSTGWAIFHFFCGWLYVLYAVIARGSEIIPAVKLLFGI
jgi:hypothetical protein